MKQYLLDTGPLASLLLGRPGAEQLIRQWLIDREVATSMLVYGEVVEYLKSSTDFRRHQAALRTLLREVQAHSLTYSVVERYAELRRMMRPPHGPGLIGDVDTLIAATALERQLTLVTIDADFQRVPDLQVMLIPRAQLRPR